MPSIAVQAAKVAITAATSKGVLTVTSTAYIHPGTNAWAVKDDGSVRYRVKILAITGSTTLVARRWPSKKEPDSNTTHDQENYGPPSYGLSDLSALTGGSAHLSIEAQTAPVDPAFSKRVVP
jgi:hypothetical protein